MHIMHLLNQGNCSKSKHQIQKCIIKVHVRKEANRLIGKSRAQDLSSQKYVNQGSSKYFVVAHYASEKEQKVMVQKRQRKYSQKENLMNSSIL